MRYTLSTLLKKMGLFEELSPGSLLPFEYEAEGKYAVGGFAEIRLSEDGRVLTAELQHWKEMTDQDIDESDLDDDMLGRLTETFFMRAIQMAETGTYAVMALSIDGEDYFDPNNEGLIELGLSIFHSRIVELTTKIADQQLDYAQERLAEYETRPDQPRREVSYRAVSPDVLEAIVESENVVLFPA